MSKIDEKLVLLERRLGPRSRWVLCVFILLLAGYLGIEFGEKIGKAIYYFTH